MKNYPK